MNKAIQFIQKSFYKKEFVNLSLSSISSDGLSQKIKYLILWMKLSDDVFGKKKEKKKAVEDIYWMVNLLDMLWLCKTAANEINGRQQKKPDCDVVGF